MTGEELKKFRIKTGLTQKRFGEELGLKHPQIQVSQLESGKRPITVRIIKTLELWKENMGLERKNKILTAEAHDNHGSTLHASD